MLVFVTIVAALLGWAFMFVPERAGLWHRTAVVAGLLTLLSCFVLAIDDRLTTVLGPVDATELAIGFGLGLAWLVATHVGYRLLSALFPSFAGQVADLYRIEKGERESWIWMPVVAMGAAEELVFRGVVQAERGLVVAVAAYAAVQLVERKWALVLAAVLCGTVWGLLFDWRDGLVAPIAAHVLWTGSLMFLWKLPAARLDWRPQTDLEASDHEMVDARDPHPSATREVLDR